MHITQAEYPFLCVLLTPTRDRAPLARFAGLGSSLGPLAHMWALLGNGGHAPFIRRHALLLLVRHRVRDQLG